MKYLKVVTNESRMRSSPFQQVDFDLFEWEFDSFLQLILENYFVMFRNFHGLLQFSEQILNFNLFCSARRSE